MSRSGIDRRAIKKVVDGIQKEFDRHPVRIPVEVEQPELPRLSAGSVHNYHGPVFYGDASGAQLAWNNEIVTQSQVNSRETISPGYEQLAEFVVKLLQQLPNLGLEAQQTADAEEAAQAVLAEVTETEPNPTKIRRALNMFKGILAPVATGATAGVTSGATEWAKAAISGLSNLF